MNTNQYSIKYKTIKCYEKYAIVDATDRFFTGNFGHNGCWGKQQYMRTFSSKEEAEKKIELIFLDSDIFPRVVRLDIKESTSISKNYKSKIEYIINVIYTFLIDLIFR